MRKAVARILPQGPRDLGGTLLGLRLDIMSIGEFYVSLDDPHRTWLPGDEVLGQIILATTKNLVNVAVTLSLIGVIKINSLSHKLRPVKQELFNHTIRIYGDETGQAGLFKGEHRFPFIVKLPVKRIFTSIEFGKGLINYILRAAIGSTQLSPVSQSGELSNPTCTSEKVLNILKPIDVLLLPPAKPKRLIIKDPRQQRLLMRTHLVSSSATLLTTLSTELNATDTPSESSGSIKLSFEIPQRGFIRGELIPMRLLINHFRQLLDLNGVIVTLVRVCRLNNAPGGFLELFRKDLQQVILPLYVDPESKHGLVTTNLRVPPDAFPTIEKCPLVGFQYYIEVLVNLLGKPVDINGGAHTPRLVDQEGNSPVGLDASIEAPSRVAFVNTDKFKRLRKFLQLTQEIIIGTHRLIPNDGLLPWLRRLSLLGMALPQVGTNPTTPLEPPMPLVLEQELRNSPEFSEVPGYTENIDTDIPNNFGAIATPYHEVSVSESSDEKQRLQAQEAALLPLAPPDSDDDALATTDVPEALPSLPPYMGNPTAGGENVSDTLEQ